MKEVKNHILQQVEKGNIGAATMSLYDSFPARDVNKAVKELLDEGSITISTPVTGNRAKTSKDYGVKQALQTHNFDIRKA